MNILNIKNAFLVIIIISVALSFILIGCQSDKKQAKAPIPRPVSYVELKKVNPTYETLIAGSVVAWKKEPVGFDVNGRVQFVQEPGTIVQGSMFDKDGQVIKAGTLIASLQDKRYQIRVDESKANIQEIRASYRQSLQSYKRQKNLLSKGAGAQQYVDDALAALRTSQAQLRSAEDQLREAELNSSDTALRAPFSGEIAKAHVIPGGYVERGEPVVTVQMMDPIKVAVAVSPEVESQLNYNDLAKVYIDGEEHPLQGWVWNKAPVADSVTRTFVVTLLVRNRRLEVGIPEEIAKQDIARTYSLQNLESINGNGKASYYINEESIHEDESGHYVWKAEGLKISDLSGSFNPVFKVSKVRIVLGEKSYPFMQIFTYREVADFGKLNPKEDLLVGKLSRDIVNEQSVALSRERWLLRPGQIANVDLSHQKLNEGFYVPAQSLIKQANNHRIFVVEDVQEKGQHAQVIDVKAGKNFGTLIEVIPSQKQAIKEGMKLIVDGAQYVQNGDLVNAFKSAEVTL